MSYRNARRNLYAERYKELPEDIRQKLQASFPRKEVTQKHDISWRNPFTNIIEDAEAFAKDWKKTIDDVKLQHQYVEDYGSYSSEVYLEVQGLETDDQYHERLAEQHETTSRREEYEREEFERLKAKFLP